MCAVRAGRSAGVVDLAHGGAPAMMLFWLVLGRIGSDAGE
jgi:hypothetical protein